MADTTDPRTPASGGPLAGIKIADFTQMMAGPFATQVLADLGADVIKIEKLDTGEWERGLASLGEYVHGQSPFFLAMNRGKRSVAIDMKSPRAKDVIDRLIAEADVVINNFRPGAMDRLGYSYEAVRKINPDIVYLNSTGYGPSGPFVKRPGQDLLLQAYSGLAAQTGPADRPPTPLANSVVDAITALYNVIGVLSGLIGRRSGGTQIDVNMLSSALAVQCQELFAHMNLNQQFQRSESGLACPWNAAPYGIYQVADGYIALGMADLGVIAQLLESAELAEVAATKDPFQDRDLCRNTLAAALADRRRDEVIDLLLTADVWCAPVLDFDEVVELPQVAENGVFVEMEHPAYGQVRSVDLPIRFSGGRGADRLPPPMPGEHTAEVLAELGFTDDEVAGLLGDRVVSQWTNSDRDSAQ